ncbi:hypothetical protein ASE70_13690 [Sphingomonas sp. Leaf22]|nr:hypothetical protein ASE70_13690 [Sphingomonas sp. Leaf22]
MRRAMILLLGLIATPVMAQSADERVPLIQVMGVGTVSTPPDVATISYSVIGEGRTADDASAALATKQRAIVAELTALLGRGARLSSGEVSVIEARSDKCENFTGYNSRPRLSEGDCAVTGYIATLQGTARTGAVDRAGTAVGAVARLGARDARIQGFSLRDPTEAQRRATAAAIAAARAKAEAMAAGAGVRLGELLALHDPNAQMDMAMSADDIGSMSLGNARPRVEIAVAPKAIETQARVNARYAIRQ